MDALLKQLGIRLPIIQAPMAGVSTPAMAAAVCNSGGLGSIGVGNVNAESARDMIRTVRQATDRPFNVNVFCHQPAVADRTREQAWLAQLAPHFARFHVRPPSELREAYQSFLTDDDTLAMLVEERSGVVSFHFGLPSPKQVQTLHDSGAVLLATATNLDEGRAVEAAGIDAVVAQGDEAGGHRGTFDPERGDERLGTMALTRLLVTRLSIPVIAAGGIMDGAGIAASLTLGAAAVQLGTAFITCNESSADADYRARLLSAAAEHTVMTKAISGRLARSLVNETTAITGAIDASLIPSYPIAYDAAKALFAAAKSAGASGFGAQWSGQGAPLARAMPAAELIRILENELQQEARNH